MNSIQKKKGALIAISVIALVFGLGALIGGIVLLVVGISGVAASLMPGLLQIIFGAVLVILGFVAIPFGVRYLWVACALKATKGSIANENLAKAGTVNGKKCPNCGCTNTPENTKCSSCGADLE